jgi:hypothetical protein
MGKVVLSRRFAREFFLLLGPGSGKPRLGIEDDRQETEEQNDAGAR